MRIAVASDGLGVSTSFENCVSFMFYTVEQGRIVACQNVPNQGIPLPSLASTLKQLDVFAVIAHSFDPSSIAALTRVNINAVITKHNSPRTATDEYLYHFLMCDQEFFEGEEA